MKFIILAFTILLPNTLHSQWTTQTSGTTENLRSIYFLNSMTGYAAGENGKVLRTANGGNIWDSVSTGITQNINSIYFFNAASGIACADDGIIIATANSGTNWVTVTSGVTDNLNAISFVNTKGVCSGAGGTLLYSTNSGLNWTIAENGFFVNYFGADMFTESIAYASGVNSIFQPFVAKSTNGGMNWSFTNFYLNGNEGNLSDIDFISANTGFASSRVFDGQGGISRTTDGGANWTTQLFAYQLHSIDFAGMNTGYCVGENGIMLKTTTGGLGWDILLGAVATLKSVQFTDSITGYTAGDLGLIMKTTNGGLSAITDPGELIPDNYVLYQNYPNPFNPVTTIKFFIADADFVSLKIYNTLGNEIAVLINENLSAGDHNIAFDGSNLASGIYYYKFVFGDFAENRKMILIK